MQDSTEDWSREALTMREVYKNSLITIAATGAHNSMEGCFFHRNPQSVKPLRVAAELDVLGKGLFYCLDRETWAKGVEKSPLSRRAWVLQEVKYASC